MHGAPPSENAVFYIIIPHRTWTLDSSAISICFFFRNHAFRCLLISAFHKRSIKKVEKNVYNLRNLVSIMVYDVYLSVLLPLFDEGKIVVGPLAFGPMAYTPKGISVVTLWHEPLPMTIMYRIQIFFGI